MAPNITAETVMEAVTALRTEVEKKTINQDVIDRCNAVLDTDENRNQKINALETEHKALNETVEKLKEEKEAYVTAKKVSDEAAIEVKTRIDCLEAELARGLKGQANDAEDFRGTPEFKALEEFCRKGEARMDEEHKVLLRTDSDIDGGVTTAPEMDSMITKRIVEIDPVRGVAKVRTTGNKSLILVQRTGEPVAQYEGEAEENEESASTYGSETVTPFRLTHTTPITRDLLQDSMFNMEAEIIDDGSQAFGFAEGNNFILGSGSKRPEGIFVNAALQTDARTTTASGLLDPESIILLSGDLKTGYSAGYMLNRRTLAIIRTFKSTTGQFLWQPGLNGPVANTLNGFPYSLANSVPDVAASAFAVGFGDWFKGYTIVDRTGMEIIRDEITQARKAIILFTMLRWNTGQVTLVEAMKLLKIKA